MNNSTWHYDHLHENHQKTFRSSSSSVRRFSCSRFSSNLRFNSSLLVSDGSLKPSGKWCTQEVIWSSKLVPHILDIALKAVSTTRLKQTGKWCTQLPHMLDIALKAVSSTPLPCRNLNRGTSKSSSGNRLRSSFGSWAVYTGWYMAHCVSTIPKCCHSFSTVGIIGQGVQHLQHSILGSFGDSWHTSIVNIEDPIEPAMWPHVLSHILHKVLIPSFWIAQTSGICDFHGQVTPEEVSKLCLALGRAGFQVMPHFERFFAQHFVSQSAFARTGLAYQQQMFGIHASSICQKQGQEYRHGNGWQGVCEQKTTQVRGSATRLHGQYQVLRREGSSDSRYWKLLWLSPSSGRHATPKYRHRRVFFPSVRVFQVHHGCNHSTKLHLSTHLPTEFFLGVTILADPPNSLLAVCLRPKASRTSQRARTWVRETDLWMQIFLFIFLCGIANKYRETTELESK